LNPHNYYIDVELGSGSTRIPVLEFNGAKPGRTLFLVAGVHGDEYEAAEAIYRLFSEFKSEKISGRVIAIPIANPLAFEAQSRMTPKSFDGLNLAREFPGNTQGTATPRIAANIWNLIGEFCGPDDLLVDLHSGGQHYSYAHLAGVRVMELDSQVMQRSMTAARAMQIENLWFMDPTPGTLTFVANQNLIPAIGCEMEGRGGLNEEDAENYLNGLRNLMKVTGHSTEGIPTSTSGSFWRTTTITSRTAGYARVLPKIHKTVKSGEVICKIFDPFGEVIEEVISSCTGQIWASRTNPSVGIGEIIALVQLNNTRREE
jgi:predicted deacylase